MRDKGQIELIALVGIALLVLGAIAYFMFFKPAAPTYSKLLIQVKAPKKPVCVKGATDVQLTIVNPATNPPAAVTVNASAKGAIVAAVLEGAPIKLPSTVVLAPGDFVVFHLYVSPQSAGNHLLNITVSYLMKGIQKPIVETYKVNIKAVTCG